MVGPVGMWNESSTDAFNGTNPVGDWRVTWGGNLIVRPDAIHLMIDWKAG
jgi:hypothetical protein